MILQHVFFNDLYRYMESYEIGLIFFHIIYLYLYFKGPIVIHSVDI